jgi:hypothetical protein
MWQTVCMPDDEPEISTGTFAGDAEHTGIRRKRAPAGGHPRCQILYSLRASGLLCVLFADQVIGQTGSFVEAVETIKKSAVPILCAKTDETRKVWEVEEFAGSGFFVHRAGVFVTADHVLAAMEARGNGCQVPAVYIARGGWRHVKTLPIRYLAFRFSDCVRNAALDVAACHIENVAGLDSSADMAALGFVVPPEGTAVAFTGFPLSRVAPISAQGSIAAYYDFDDAGVPGTMYIDKNAWPGASGSPVYLQNGQVVAVLTMRGAREATGLAMARPLLAVRATIEQAIQKGQTK